MPPSRQFYPASRRPFGVYTFWMSPLRIEVEPRPTPKDPRTEESEALAAGDGRAPATLREEEQALISNELADANLLLAERTQASAELLAKETQTSAELLAKITQASADQLRHSNEITTKMVHRLTVIMVAIALIQTALTAIALFAQLK